MEIENEVAPAKDLINGNLNVGTSAVRLCPPGPYKATKGVIIKTPSTNTAPIFISTNPNVRADWSPGGGFPILKNESLVLPIDGPHHLWCIAADADQQMAWMAV